MYPYITNTELTKGGRRRGGREAKRERTYRKSGQVLHEIGRLVDILGRILKVNLFSDKILPHQIDGYRNKLTRSGSAAYLEVMGGVVMVVEGLLLVCVAQYAAARQAYLPVA